MNKYIYITTSFEGFHRYINAPEEVSYLRNLHRHIFGVKVTVSVQHNERDIEFIMFKHQIEDFIMQYKTNNNNMSCEAIAEAIYYYVKDCYPNRTYEVVVNEDNENGAVVGDM